MAAAAKSPVPAASAPRVSQISMGVSDAFAVRLRQDGRVAQPG
jgi:hypothetical protein